MTRRQCLAAFMAQGVPREKTARKSSVILLSGDIEHDSERTLSRLISELEAKQPMRCNLLVAEGKRDLPGLELIEDADLIVMFVRSLALPGNQMGQIRAYMNSGKPIVALRASIQAFENWKEFGAEILGGTFRGDSGGDSGTDVKVAGEASNPILQGVPAEFHSRSSLYQVGPLSGGARPLLTGTAGSSSSPVAWTRSHKGGRVFYTSLGHPEDINLVPFRTLLTNAVRWTLTQG